MKRLLASLVIVGALGLVGCSTTIQNLEGAFNAVTTTTVDPSYVNIALNTYYGLKSTATGYGNYCITQHFPQPVCSAANRRAVIKYIKAGDGAAAELQPALSSDGTILSTTYNVLVGAINGLKASPIAQTQGVN